MDLVPELLVRCFMLHRGLACLTLVAICYTSIGERRILLVGEWTQAKCIFEQIVLNLFAVLSNTIMCYSVVVGAATGAAAAAISCPMEVATVRMSNDASLPPEERRNYKGLTDVVKRIYTEEGISAFWRGSIPFAQRAALVGVFQVATLDQFKELYAHYFNQKKGSLGNVFCSAMSSGLIYSIATMPLEASKNRMASQKPDPATGKLPYTSTLQTLRTVTANEGFLALYNGFVPYYIRCGGHTIAMFVAVQMMRDYYTGTQH